MQPPTAKPTKAPAFQYYPKDLLTSQKVAVMTAEEFGGYWLLCSHSWLSDPQGTLPNDDRLLARLARLTDEAWANHRSTILAPFVLNGETLEHPRLLEELRKQQDWREKSRTGGRHSAEKYRQKIKDSLKGGSTTVEPKGNTAVCSLQSSSSSASAKKVLTPSQKASKNCKPKPAALEFDFENTWGQYPRQEGRRDAERHFRASVRTPDDCLDIQNALQNYLQKLRRESTEPRFIQKGSTWFNNWRDWINYKRPGVGTVVPAPRPRPADPHPDELPTMEDIQRAKAAAGLIEGLATAKAMP